MSGKDKIIFIDKTEKKDSMFCNFCHFPLLTKNDFEYSKKHNVCHECFLTHVESRKIEWSKGWRPSKQKIKEYILYRKSLIKD